MAIHFSKSVLNNISTFTNYLNHYVFESIIFNYITLWVKKQNDSHVIEQKETICESTIKDKLVGVIIFETLLKIYPGSSEILQNIYTFWSLPLVPGTDLLNPCDFLSDYNTRSILF